MAELRPLLSDLSKALESEEPRPCKEILAVLLQNSWPEEQQTLLAELNRLVNRYRLQEAFTLLTQEMEPERVKKELVDTVSPIHHISPDIGAPGRAAAGADSGHATGSGRGRYCPVDRADRSGRKI